jgi:hypothetical protein
MENKIIAILITVLLFTSCTEEKVIPHQEVRTTTQQQQDKEPVITTAGTDTKPSKKENIYTFRGTYYLDTIEVNKPIEGGPRIIQGLGNLIADLIVRIGGNFDVSVDPIPFDVSDVDLDIVKKAIVKKISIEVVDKKKKAKLNFIKTLKLDLEDPKSDKKITLINAKYKNRAKNKKCGDYCFDIIVEPINLVQFIGDTKEIIVAPEVEIGKTPKENFSIQIAIDFEVGVKMPL